MTLAIDARGLVKNFGETRAVNGVDLQVPEGAIYGVLGPNGAGKTTTLRMVAALLRPDSGQIRVDGIEVQREPQAASTFSASSSLAAATKR